MSVEKVVYKAVLFDLDGVLVDMREAHFEALNLALSVFGTKIKSEEHESIFNGLSSRKKLALLVGEGRIPEDSIDSINEMKQEFTKKIIPKICIPDKKKIEMMEKLNHSGVHIGCCSNSTEAMVHIMLRSAGLFDYCKVIFGNDTVTRPKPDPEMYLRAMYILGVKPEETIIVEDSYYGIEAAKASGATVYVVKGVKDVHIGLFGDILSL
jgi:HAD superfamily hydrolase (TIGR01509 family)